MNKIFLLSLLILTGSIEASYAEKTQAQIAQERGAPNRLDSQDLLNDIFQLAKDLFNLRNEKKPVEITDKGIENKIKLWDSYIKDAAGSYITPALVVVGNESEILKKSALEIISLNSKIVELFSSLRNKELDNLNKVKKLRLIYDFVNIDIENLISKLDKIKPSNLENEKARKLAMDICKLLQNIGNKIIADYTFAPGDVLKKIDTDITYIFMNSDFAKVGVSEDKKNILKELFTKLSYLVSFADDNIRDNAYNKINRLYWEIFNLINLALKAFKDKERFLFKNKQTQQQLYLREFLTNKFNEFKNINEAVAKLPTKTEADKNAVAIVKLLLKLYEPILKKIEKEFDYKPIIKKELSGIDLKSKLSEENNLNELSQKIEGIKPYVLAFIGSEDSGYNKDAYENQYDFNLKAAFGVMQNVASKKNNFVNRGIKDRLNFLEANINSINKYLKNANLEIDKVSKSKSVRAVLKDLLSKYEEIRNKFESDMKEALKITKFDRVKDFFTGKKKGSEKPSEYKGGKEEDKKFKAMYGDL